MGIVTVEELIRLGEEENIVGHSTATTNQRSPIAFLCFSSGTTGLPKVNNSIYCSLVALKGSSGSHSPSFRHNRQRHSTEKRFCSR
jgi:long-subunit acyl-CoA synthetase (AMP-forming)